MALTWQQKFDRRGEPEVKALERPFAGKPAGSKMLIASPRVVEDYVRQIPTGETRTIRQLREDLATAYGADVTCPTSTAIFLRIVSELALERLDRGEDAAPFWRVVAPDDPLAQKLPCGSDWISERRDHEASALAAATPARSR